MILTYNNKIVTHNNKMVSYQLPDNTLLFKFSAADYDPSSLTTLTGATWTQVSASPNIWMWDGRSVVATDWSTAFYQKWSTSGNNVEIVGAGTLTTPIKLADHPGGSYYYGIFANNKYLVSVFPLISAPNATDCSRLFWKCPNLAGSVSINCPSATAITDCFGGNNTNSNTALTSATITTGNSLVIANQVFRGCQALQSFSISNTSSVENFAYLCTGCSSLKSVPLLATDSATNVTQMFNNCLYVDSGALALYNQMANQTYPPTSHSQTFRNCGSNTTTGAAELAQIPSNWK